MYDVQKVSICIFGCKKELLTTLQWNKILKRFFTAVIMCNTYLEKAVTALGQVSSGYTATCNKLAWMS